MRVTADAGAIDGFIVSFFAGEAGCCITGLTVKWTVFALSEGVDSVFGLAVDAGVGGGAFETVVYAFFAFVCWGDERVAHFAFCALLEVAFVAVLELFVGAWSWEFLFFVARAISPFEDVWMFAFQTTGAITNVAVFTTWDWFTVLDEEGLLSLGTAASVVLFGAH